MSAEGDYAEQAAYRMANLPECICDTCRQTRAINRRRSILKSRALANPEGLTPYAFTKGFYRDDALRFWQDAKALGLVVVGRSPRGAKLLALPPSAS